MDVSQPQDTVHVRYTQLLILLYAFIGSSHPRWLRVEYYDRLFLF